MNLPRWFHGISALTARSTRITLQLRGITSIPFLPPFIAAAKTRSCEPPRKLAGAEVVFAVTPVANTTVVSCLKGQLLRATCTRMRSILQLRVRHDMLQLYQLRN